MGVEGRPFLAGQALGCVGHLSTVVLATGILAHTGDCRNGEANTSIYRLRDNVVTWKRFSHYWAFIRGIHMSSNSRGVFIFSLELAPTNCQPARNLRYLDDHLMSLW